jgi:hypothetical protein
MNRRTAYVLTGNVESPRALFSKGILEQIGFDVKCIVYTPNKDAVLSNRISMQGIYQMICDSEEPYAYVFEDDINLLAPIKLDEIIQYEAISERFFYLGLCELSNGGVRDTGIKLNEHAVIEKSGEVRGLHAIGLSKKGAKELLEFSRESAFECMDMVLEDLSRKYPANVVRYDLQSYIYGHKGVIFQDRRRFPSTI